MELRERKVVVETVFIWSAQDMLMSLLVSMSMLFSMLILLQ